MEMEKEKQNEEQHIDKKQKTEHQQDEAVKAPRRVKIPRKDKLDPKKGLHYYLHFGITPLDIMLNPPACIKSPPYMTMYDEEVSEFMLKEDFRKLIASNSPNKF